MKGEQLIQQTAHVQKHDDGSMVDFASDYPGVMVAIVGALVAICWYLLKRRGQRES
jgi:hypothetical protein